MIPDPHFISSNLVSVVHYHELFSLLGLDSIRFVADFHLGLMLVRLVMELVLVMGQG